VSWANGCWACQDLDLGPHPYQGLPRAMSPGWHLRPAGPMYRWRPPSTARLQWFVDQTGLDTPARGGSGAPRGGPCPARQTPAPTSELRHENHLLRGALAAPWGGLQVCPPLGCTRAHGDGAASGDRCLAGRRCARDAGSVMRDAIPAPPVAAAARPAAPAVRSAAAPASDPCHLHRSRRPARRRRWPP
jgi:hypothetical protein